MRVLIGENKNIYFINNIYQCLFGIIKIIIIIYYTSHPALAIHPMPSANKMGSNISNKSVKKSGRIGQNSIKV